MKNKPCPCSGNSIVRSKGEFTVAVRRLSFNINQDLPYTIWGALYLDAKNFATPLQAYLPAGVTVTSIVQNDSIRFTYNQGVKSDIIVVRGLPTNQVGYVEMLANLKTNYLNTELVYWNCNAGISFPPPLLALDQIKNLQGKPLYLEKIGGLGSKQTETIIPLTRKMVNNTVVDMVEISMRNQDIKPDNVWVHLFGYVFLTEPSEIQFYWQVIINDIVNMNANTMSLDQIKEESLK